MSALSIPGVICTWLQSNEITGGCGHGRIRGAGSGVMAVAMRRVLEYIQAALMQCIIIAFLLGTSQLTETTLQIPEVKPVLAFQRPMRFMPLLYRYVCPTCPTWAPSGRLRPQSYRTYSACLVLHDMSFFWHAES